MHPEAYKLTPPSKKRPGIFRNGIIQIVLTRACTLSCHGCTQGSNLAGRPAIITLDDFEQAVASLAGYWGLVACFGGQPTLHPQFPDICRILRAYFPREQRGLWTNALNGHGAVCRETFDERQSNFNLHLSEEAAREFRRDWPEAVPYLKGLDQDSVHGSPWVAVKDVVPDEEERWKLIGACDISKWWSAALGPIPGRGLRAYACEIAYAQAALHADDPDWPDVGIVPTPGWWRQPIEAYEAQINQHCHACGIPLRRPGQFAIGGDHEEFSETHRYIARPKTRGRPVQIIESIGTVERPDRPATDYLPNTTPKQR